MNTKLSQLEQRIKSLEELADKVYKLAKKLGQGASVQPDLSVSGQKWYRGCRELMVQHEFSGLREFESCYDSSIEFEGKDYAKGTRSFTDIEQYISKKLDYDEEQGIKPTIVIEGKSEQDEHFMLFSRYFRKARALLLSLVDEVLSRELPIVTQLSFEIATDEFETAETILKEGGKEEVFIRVSGVIARVALERHLLTVIDDKKLTMILNPPSKKKPTASDLIETLSKNKIIVPIQKKELESLFGIGDNCAHPKDKVKVEDVQRLINRGQELASTIL